MPPQITAPTTTIASHGSYADALATTGYLYDRGIPAGHLSIVGAGLRQLEQPAPGAILRLTLAGAGHGAWLGALVGALIALFATSPNNELTIVGWSILYGVLFGTLRGFLQGLVHNRPGAHRWESIEASRYDVLCVSADASVALQLLPTGTGDTRTGTGEAVRADRTLSASTESSPAPDPAVVESVAAEPAVAEAVTAEPAVGEAVGSGPAAAEAPVAEPAVPEPAVKGSAVTDPAGAGRSPSADQDERSATTPSTTKDTKDSRAA